MTALSAARFGPGSPAVSNASQRVAGSAAPRETRLVVASSGASGLTRELGVRPCGLHFSRGSSLRITNDKA